MRPLLNLFAVLLFVGFHGVLLAQDDAVPWTTPVRDIRVEHAGTRVFPVYDLRKERLRQVEGDLLRCHIPPQPLVAEAEPSPPRADIQLPYAVVRVDGRLWIGPEPAALLIHRSRLIGVRSSGGSFLVWSASVLPDDASVKTWQDARTALGARFTIRDLIPHRDRDGGPVYTDLRSVFRPSDLRRSSSFEEFEAYVSDWAFSGRLLKLHLARPRIGVEGDVWIDLVSKEIKEARREGSTEVWTPPPKTNPERDAALAAVRDRLARLWPLLLVSFPALWLCTSFVISRAGWHRFASKYRASARPAGRAHTCAHAKFASSIASYGHAVRVVFGEAGVYVFPICVFRAFHPPFLVPWEKVAGVKERRGLFRSAQELSILDEAGEIRLRLSPDACLELQKVRPARPPVASREAT